MWKILKETKSSKLKLNASKLAVKSVIFKIYDLAFRIL